MQKVKSDLLYKYLYLTQRKADSQMISSVPQALEAIAINNTFKTFYENVYKSGLQTDTAEDTFSPLFPSLSDDQNISWSSKCKKEVVSAIKGLQFGKTPGPDGLSSEFYKEFPTYWLTLF